MRFVILGSGGRENSIIQKLHSEKRDYNLICISRYKKCSYTWLNTYSNIYNVNDRLFPVRA